MCPTVVDLKSLVLKSKTSNRNININSLPVLQPILQFDDNFDSNGEEVNEDSEMNTNSENEVNEHSDEVDGNISSKKSNTCFEDEYNNANNCRNPDFCPTNAIVRRQAPSFLLIEALIWKLCGEYEDDFYKRKRLYLLICQRLEHYKIVGSSYQSEALQPVRDKIVFKLTELVTHVRATGMLPNAVPNACQYQYFNPKSIPVSPHPVNNSSRYRDEFEDLGVIEEGGFGVVYKAKHRFDNCNYAVKMIRFRYKNENAFKKITREVQLYANLPSHPNVVAYKTAWLENWCLHKEKLPSFTAPNDCDQEMKDHSEIQQKSELSSNVSIRFEESSRSGIRIESSQTRLISVNNSFNQQNIEIREYSSESESESDDDDEYDEAFENSDFDNNIRCSSSDSLNRSEASTVRRRRTISSCSAKSQSDSIVKYGHCNSDELNNKSIPDCDNDMPPENDCPFACSNFGAVLYIQMELCGKNLKTYLRERNDEIFAQMDTRFDLLHYIDAEASLDIFRQVLKGVNYIHSQHLIHRDLKPQNILFGSDDKIKIGDFGLATLHNSIDNDEVTLHMSNARESKSEDDNHTRGLGTSIYAAPEQKCGSLYDEKADMYSIGIVLFELFYPLSTDMEKAKCINEIAKKRVIPKNLQKRWPIVSEMIKSLTDSNPKLRPKAIEVLHSSLFLTKEQQQIKVLEKKLMLANKKIESKDKEIAHLRDQNRERDDKIASLRQQLSVMFIAKSHEP